MTEMLAVVTITLFAVISPGPDFAMVTRNSLVLSRRAGVLTAFGIGLGVLVHVSYAILGVGMIIKQSAWLFHAIKLVGAAYLIWLGLKMLRTKPGASLAVAATQHLTDISALRTGFLANALNPKTTVFVLSLFVQIVSTETSMPVQIGYGAFNSLAHIAWFSIVAVSLSGREVRERLLKVRHHVDRIFGVLLVGLGIWLALGEHRDDSHLANKFGGQAEIEVAGEGEAAAANFASCDPDYHEAKMNAWRIGKDMVSPDGRVATNRVLEAYHRKNLQEGCKH